MLPHRPFRGYSVSQPAGSITFSNDAPGQPVFPGIFPKVCARSIYAPRILSALQLVTIPATQPLAVALVVIKDM